MVKTMCNKRAKSGISPVFSTVLWFFCVYLFYIIWGICEIVFEFELSIVKFIVCLLITVYYTWFLINKILTEYEFEITEDEFIVTSVLSKRKKVLIQKKLCEIQKICEDKKCCDTKTNRSFKRPLQKGKTAYVVFKDAKKLQSIEIKTDEKFIGKLKKGIGEK